MRRVLLRNSSSSSMLDWGTIWTKVLEHWALRAWTA
jgi:hypothetical protein